MKNQYTIDGLDITIKTLTSATVTYTLPDGRQFRVSRKWFNNNAKIGGGN